MRTQPILSGLILGASLLTLWPKAAEARPEYPGAIQEQANMVCVPTCLLCHTTSPGTASSWQQKTLAVTLSGYGLTGDESSMEKAWASYAADPVNATNVGLIQQGIDPQTMQNVCGPTYGCGATVAPRPLAESQNNRDPAPAVAAALAAIAGLFAMRRRRR